MDLQTSQEAIAFAEHFLQNSLTGIKPSEYDEVLDDLKKKRVMMNFNKKPIVKPTKRKGIKRNRLVKLDNCKYSDFDQLRSLWKGYADTLLGGEKNNLKVETIQETLLRADFHGASISVAKSKCKTLENLSGTIITETKRMFQIVTKDDRVLKIPKSGSVFTVDYPGYRITILGDQFCFKPAFRTVKRFANYNSTLEVI